MKITVLGSGVCASQLPGTESRYPPGFLVTWGEDEEHKVLFECSEGIRFRIEKAGYDYFDINHIAISHAHPDHYALPHYLQSVFGRGIYQGEDYQGSELHIYCPEQIVDDFPMLWHSYNPEWKDKDQYWWPHLTFHGMSQPSPSAVIWEDIGDGSLNAFKVYHGFGKVDALAYRLETPEGIFAYSGDTGDCVGVRKIAKNADIFVCEASARIGNEADSGQPDGYGHLTPFLAGQIAKYARVKRLVLCHYTGLDSNKAMVEDCMRSGFRGEISIAKDLEVLEV